MLDTVSESPYFEREADVYRPAPAAMGPWAPNMVNGSALCALLGYAVDETYGQDGLIPARFNVELWRPVLNDALCVETRVLRDGRAIKVVEALLIQAGEVRVRATCQLLKPSGQPAGERWSPADWTVPAPEALSKVPGMARDLRLITGSLKGATQRRAWLRETGVVVAGAALTPFQRMACIADFVSPFSSSGTEGLSFINTDVSLSLHRLPIGEWIGIEVADHQSSGGIANGCCRIYDQTGSIGLITAIALVRRDALALDGKFSGDAS